MATCSFCELEMTIARSCVADALHIAGTEFPLARHGGNGRCGACGVSRRGFHHPGCDLQRCPRCRGQLFSCGCPFDEHATAVSLWGPEPDESDPIDLIIPYGGDQPCWDVPLEPIGVDPNGNPIERGWINGVEVIVHRDDVPPSDVTTVHGIPCTTAVRTIIDISYDLEPERIRSIIADATQRGLFTETELRQRLADADMATHVGAAAVRCALDGST